MDTLTPEQIAEALLLLVRFNIPPDVQELLVRGDVSRGVPPGALAACLALGRERVEHLEKALKLISAQRPNSKPEWGDSSGWGNSDDSESLGHDICAWGHADIADEALQQTPTGPSGGQGHSLDKEDGE